MTATSVTHTSGERTLVRLLLMLLMYVLLAGLVWLVFSQWQVSKSKGDALDGLTLDKKVLTFKELNATDRDALLSNERARLIAAPLQKDVLENLSIGAMISGDEALSGQYIKLAADRTLHDSSIQLLAMQNALKKNDYDDVLYRLDGLTRINKNNQKIYFAILQSLSEQPDSAVAVAKYLVQLPPWRSAFLTHLGEESKRISAVHRLMVAMRKTSEPATNSEMKPLFDRLVRAKNFDQMYFLWLDSLSPQELTKTGNLFDGNFDTSINNLYFSWTFTPIKNAKARIVPRASGSADRVLRLEFAESNIPFYNFLQFLKLNPGEHQLRGEEMADNFASSGGLVWAVLCANTGEFLGQSYKIIASTSWQPFSFNFTVPANNCETQYLRLQAASSATLDQQFKGNVSFDSLVID